MRILTMVLFAVFTILAPTTVFADKCDDCEAAYDACLKAGKSYINCMEFRARCLSKCF